MQLVEQEQRNYQYIICPTKQKKLPLKFFKHKENISISMAKDKCTLKLHFSVVYCGKIVRNFATECVIEIYL